MRVSGFIERNVVEPEGFFGGRPGRTSAFLVKVGDHDTYQTMKEAFNTACDGKFSDIYMHRGDIIRLETSGGGGYGDPLKRIRSSTLCL